MKILKIEIIVITYIKLIEQIFFHRKFCKIFLQKKN